MEGISIANNALGPQFMTTQNITIDGITSYYNDIGVGAMWRGIGTMTGITVKNSCLDPNTTAALRTDVSVNQLNNTCP